MASIAIPIQGNRVWQLAFKRTTIQIGLTQLFELAAGHSTVRFMKQREDPGSQS